MSLYLGNNLISGNTSLAKIEQEIPLGASKYSGETLEQSAGWLKSTGQWNSGSLYSTFYTEAVDNIGSDFAKGKIVASTDTYTDYDLVVNTTAQTFRLPLLDGSEDLPSDSFTSFNQSSLTTTGYTFTADYNCFVIFTGYQGNATTGLIVTVNDKLRWFSGLATVNQTFRPTCNIFVNKGDIVKVSGENGTIVIGTPSTDFGYYKAQGNGDLYFKVANTVQNLALLDVGQITNALTLKADVDLTNCTDVANIKMAHNAMPSNTYISLTLGASGSTYTAPANGWFALHYGNTSNQVNLYMYNPVTKLGNGNSVYTNGWDGYISIPVLKNDQVVVQWGGSLSATEFRFIYAKGSESEAS